MAVRLCALILAMVSGCQSFIINNTDKQVYRVIEDRQRNALGATTNVNFGPESGRCPECGTITELQRDSNT